MYQKNIFSKSPRITYFSVLFNMCTIYMVHWNYFWYTIIV